MILQLPFVTPGEAGMRTQLTRVSADESFSSYLRVLSPVMCGTPRAPTLMVVRVVV